MSFIHNSPLCPECLKKGKESRMQITKLEGLWLCRKCNYMSKDSVNEYEY